MISIVLRRLTEPVEIGGYELPAGVSVTPCIHLVHRNPEIYPEPERFLPERFLDNPPGTYTWIPFGGGVRRCLGASFAQFEMAVVLSELVKRHQIRPADPEPERVFRRAITETPRHDAEVDPQLAPAEGSEPAEHQRDQGAEQPSRTGRADATGFVPLTPDARRPDRPRPVGAAGAKTTALNARRREATSTGEPSRRFVESVVDEDATGEEALADAERHRFLAPRPAPASSRRLAVRVRLRWLERGVSRTPSGPSDERRHRQSGLPLPSHDRPRARTVAS